MEEPIYPYSNMKLKEVIEKLECFNPIQIQYNHQVIFNDGDATTLEEAVSAWDNMWKMIKPYENDKIISVHIDIVHFHHAIVTLTGTKFNKK